MWVGEAISMMWGTEGWGWGALMMLSFWVLLALLIWALVRSASQPPKDRRDPLDVLAERYARGEIDDEEYERRRRTLRG